MSETEQALRSRVMTDAVVATFTTTPGDVTARVWIVANMAYVREHPPLRVKR